MRRKGSSDRVNNSVRTLRALGGEIRYELENAGLQTIRNTAKSATELREMLHGFRGNGSIRRYMTRSPHTIAVDRTLADAHKLMRQYQIRHLPVLERGKLVGIVSERDLHLLETLRDVDPAEVKVEEAMSQDVFSVDPGASIARVARMMAERKVGSAVVVNRREVLGIFSTVDALRALADLSSDTRPRKKLKLVARVLG